MTTEPKDHKEEAKKPAEKVVRTVTSDRDVDFTALNWSISKGQTRALPDDEAAAARILLNHHIVLTT